METKNIATAIISISIFILITVNIIIPVIQSCLFQDKEEYSYDIEGNIIATNGHVYDPTDEKSTPVIITSPPDYKHAYLFNTIVSLIPLILAVGGLLLLVHKSIKKDD